MLKAYPRAEVVTVALKVLGEHGSEIVRFVRTPPGG